MECSRICKWIISNCKSFDSIELEVTKLVIYLINSFLSSVSGIMGNRGQVNYSAAKAGLPFRDRLSALMFVIRSSCVPF